MLPAIYRMRKFALWLEFEETEGWEDLTNDFANIQVTLEDGRKYGINVWTFNYLNEAKSKEGNLYVIPPDLFVAELTHDCVEQTISKLLEEGELENLLNPSVFNLNFLDPWWDIMETHDLGEGVSAELKKELPRNHKLYNGKYEVLAKRQDNDEILVELNSGELATIHLTWSGKEEQGNFPLTTYFCNSQEFWQKSMKQSIIQHQE
tara:strand:- start:57673 stop:58290 length:618 start_codon:yes stop_codon:yes gene_type:complete